MTVVMVNAHTSLSRHLEAILPGQVNHLIQVRENDGLRKYVQEHKTDLIIYRSTIPDRLETVQQIRRLGCATPILLITSHSSEEFAIAALRAGVTDYLKEPFSLEDLTLSVNRCCSALRNSETEVESTVPHLVGPERMIGESPSLLGVKEYVRNVARTQSNVLITGETGTGKELVAESIHRNSPRFAQPFVCINCAAIPETLFESELFGFEKGAFTGADSRSAGKLKEANRGTIFLDEIGDMGLSSQAKILRAIESKTIYRLGGSGSIPVDVRVIAATNQDLEARVAEGRFRKDLYFRLNVARINLPPLRERKEDIPALLEYYLREFRHSSGQRVERFSEEVSESLISYDWPGNVRELKNLIESIFLNNPKPIVSFSDLPAYYRERLRNPQKASDSELERLLSALCSTNWNKSMAAQRLHWSRMTLYRKMARYHLVSNTHPRKSETCNTSRIAP